MDNIATIYKGEDYPLKLVLKNKVGSPYDLTGATEITLRLTKQDGSILEKLLSDDGLEIVGADELGTILCTLGDADTALLKEKDLQDFDVVIDKGSARRIAYFSRKLNVRKALA